jgi:hypothetical protein
MLPRLPARYTLPVTPPTTPHASSPPTIQSVTDNVELHSDQSTPGTAGQCEGDLWNRVSLPIHRATACGSG